MEVQTCMCVLSVEHVAFFGEVSSSRSIQHCRSESVVLADGISSVLSFSFTHTHTHTHPPTHTHTHTQARTHTFTQAQPYYPESSATAQNALCCRSVLLVTSARSARSAQLRSSGISPMENLLRIQKKAVHTYNCDGVFHPLLNCTFLRENSPRIKCRFISPV